MSDFTINNLTSIHLLWVVAAVVFVLSFALILRRRAMARFVSANLQGKMAPQMSSTRKWIKTLLLAGALVAMTAAMLDIRWGRTWREVPQRGVDVMFVLDVSHSMLAQDATPNRLERAKQDILDIVEEMEGDRVGLVTFAGDTAQKSPLTSNYREFRLMLDEVGPHSVSRGGSDLGRAIEMAARGFLDKSANHKAIVVFSDGEDQDSKPVEAAKKLHKKRGIRIFTVGLGDEQKGARIPTRLADGRQGWLQYEGEDVWTKMNGKVLQEVALAADGAYVPAGTKHVSMDQVYKQHIASIEEQQYEQARVNTYIPRYQWFVGLALLLAGLEVFVRDVRRVRLPRPALVTAAALLMIVSVGAAPAASQAAIGAPHVDSVPNGTEASVDNQGKESANESPAVVVPEATYNQAVELYRGGKLDEAAARWSEVAQSGKAALAAKAHFNLGNCAFSGANKVREQQPEQAIGQLDKAIAHYRDALKLNRDDQDARANIELAARLRDQIRQQEEQKKQEEQRKQEEQKKQEQEQKQQQEQQKQDQQKQQEQEQKDQQNQQQDQQQQQQNQDQKQDQQQQNQQQNEQQKQDQQQQQQQQNEQQEQNQPQKQDQQSQSEQKENQKSDSKQGQQQSEQQKSDEQKSSEKQQEQQKSQGSQSQQSQDKQEEQNESKQNESKQNKQQEQSKQDESKKEESQQNEQQQKQDQQKQDQSSSKDQPQQDQHEQQSQQEQQKKQDQQRPQPQTAQQSHDQRQRDSQQPDPSDLQPSKPDDAKDKKPDDPTGKKLEANSSEKPPEGTPVAGQSTAELKDGKNMSKEEAAKMLQAIRDRDLLRRIQQLRKEQMQRRPVDKDW